MLLAISVTTVSQVLHSMNTHSQHIIEIECNNVLTSTANVAMSSLSRYQHFDKMSHCNCHHCNCVNYPYRNHHCVLQHSSVHLQQQERQVSHDQWIITRGRVIISSPTGQQCTSRISHLKQPSVGSVSHLQEVRDIECHRLRLNNVTMSITSSQQCWGDSLTSTAM